MAESDTVRSGSAPTLEQDQEKKANFRVYSTK